MKWFARVQEVLAPGVHKIGVVSDSGLETLRDLKVPTRIEIVAESSGGPCMLYRYNKEGQTCGDSWHMTLEEAYSQARYEYGLEPSDFLREV